MNSYVNLVQNCFSFIEQKKKLVLTVSVYLNFLCMHGNMFAISNGNLYIVNRIWTHLDKLTCSWVFNYRGVLHRGWSSIVTATLQHCAIFCLHSSSISVIQPSPRVLSPDYSWYNILPCHLQQKKWHQIYHWHEYFL